MGTNNGARLPAGGVTVPKNGAYLASSRSMTRASAVLRVVGRRRSASTRAPTGSQIDSLRTMLLSMSGTGDGWLGIIWASV